MDARGAGFAAAGLAARSGEWRTGRMILQTALLCAVLAGCRASAQDQPARITALRAQMELGVANFDREMARPNPEPDARALTNAGLCVLALGGDPKRAEAYFREMFAMQDMDPKSPGYGTVPWKKGHPEIKDPNSIEFTMSFLAPAMLRYGERLSPEFKAEALPHLKAAIEGIRRHKVPVTYGNIFLMKLGNLIMLGELANDPAPVAEGKDALDRWLAWTRAHGNNEYDSPTYAVVQFTDLENVWLHAPDAETKALAKAGLDYLWSDLAANYFAGRDSPGGPHSRSYDFLYQQGTIQHHFYLEGLSPALAGRDYFGGVWLNAIMPGDYHPASAILDLARIPERVVRQRFGAEEGRDRYNYITPGFAIGSASCYYGPQDNQISVEFATAKKMPVCSVVPDTSDAPYGKKLEKDKSGHDKPRHIKDIIAAVQEKGTILALLDLSPDMKSGACASLATNIILPVRADGIYPDGERLDVSAPFEKAVTAGSTVFVREGKSAAAFRIFTADGAGGQQASFAVKYDGNEWGAARLVAYHYKGAAAELKGAPIVAGVFACAEQCETDAQFQDFVKRVAGLKIGLARDERQCAASVQAGGTKLEAALDLQKGKIAWRRVNGADVPPACLSVNGRDIAAEILGPLKLKTPPPE